MDGAPVRVRVQLPNISGRILWFYGRYFNEHVNGVYKQTQINGGGTIL